MLNSVYKKISVVFFLTLCIVGALGFLVVLYASDMYRQEVTQKLNINLAENILTEDVLLSDGKVNQNALKQIIHMLMVINPSIEVYILNTQGKILAYSAPEGKVQRQAVDIQPVIRFIQSPTQLPLFGDDPRNPGRQKIFSASKISGDRGLEGYVYVILAGEAYDSVAGMMKNSYILRYSLAGLAISIIIALLSGLYLFSLVTRRISRLSNAMATFVSHGSATGKFNPYPVKSETRDEIDQLGISFNHMAERIQQQMEKLKENDAKRRELIANVSHDLRTPLTSLHGYIETLLLKDDTLSVAERREYLITAQNHSQQLSRLITELFDLAKLDSVDTLLNIEPFSLGELIQDVVHNFDLSAEKKGVRIKTEFGGNLPFAYGDIALIQRVLENLIDNALRYTVQGGEISVALTGDRKHIFVKVSDTGCGIPSRDVPHIFDRFYRASKSREDGDFHSGLGLAIVKRIVALHGGDIKAESAVDVGTTFSFELSAYPSPS